MSNVQLRTLQACKWRVELRMRQAWSDSQSSFALAWLFLSPSTALTHLYLFNMFACRRIVHLSRNLHTTTPVAAGGFSRFNPWAKKPESQEPVTTPVNNADAPATAFNVTYYDDEPDTLSQVSMILVVIYV